MRSLKTFFFQIDSEIKKIESLLSLIDELPQSMSEGPDLSSIKKKAIQLKGLFTHFKTRADKLFIFNPEALIEKKDTLAIQLFDLTDECATAVNRLASGYFSSITDTLPNCYEQLDLINRLCDMIQFHGEYQVPGRYRLEKQIEYISLYEKVIEEGEEVTSLMDKEEIQTSHQAFIERLTQLLEKLSKKMIKSLDSKEACEQKCIEEIKKDLNAARRVLNRKPSCDVISLTLHKADIGQSLSRLSEQLSLLDKYNEERLKCATLTRASLKPLLAKRYTYSSVEIAGAKGKKQKSIGDSLTQIITLFNALIETDNALAVAIQSIRKSSDYNQLSNLILKAKHLKSQLEKEIRHYQRLKEKEKKALLQSQKEYFFVTLYDFSRRRYPKLVKYINTYKAFGLLSEIEEKQFLQIELRIKNVFSIPDNQFEKKKRAYSRLEFSILSLMSALNEKQANFFNNNGFSQALKSLFWDVLEREDVYQHYQNNQDKSILIDVWLEKINLLSQRSSLKPWFNDLRNDFWSLKLKCTEAYPDTQFVKDAIQIFEQRCTDEALIQLSRESNGAAISFLRAHVFKPLYDLCYRLGFFRERKISLFGNEVENRMRTLIYKARKGCYEVQKGTLLRDACFVERTIQASILVQ